MGNLEHVLIFFLSISGILSDTASRSVGNREVLNDDLFSSRNHIRSSDSGTACVIECLRRSRVCGSPELPLPVACGGCVQGYTEHHGRDGLRLCQKDSSSYASAPDDDIERIVDRLHSNAQGSNHGNTAESTQLGKHKLHRLLQKFQHKLQQQQGNNGPDTAAQDPDNQYPYLGKPLGFPEQDLPETYQDEAVAEGDQDLEEEGNHGEEEEQQEEEAQDAGYHSNQEMVGYEQEHLQEKLPAESSADKEPAVVHQHPSAPQHLKTPQKGDDLLHGEKASSMADVYFLDHVDPQLVSETEKGSNDGVNFNALQKKQEPEETTYNTEHSVEAGAPVVAPQVQDEPESHDEDSSWAYMWWFAVIAGCSIAGVVGLVVAGVCWYRLQKNVKAASEAEYPAYGVTGPTQERVGSPGDRKLAQSAQMYHYQHQKQQMLAMEKANGDMTKDDEGDSEEENEEGDYTVYECPGLAPTGEMEVKNPLFSEETPVTPSDGREEHK